MRIEVTREDITNGQPGHSYSCAVAIAIQRETGLPERGDVSVNTRSIEVWHPELHTWVEYDSPTSVAMFILGFDHVGGLLQRLLARPFSFDLPIRNGFTTPVRKWEAAPEPEPLKISEPEEETVPAEEEKEKVPVA